VRLSLSEITSLFGLNRYVDRTFARRIGSAKVKLKSEVARPLSVRLSRGQWWAWSDRHRCRRRRRQPARPGTGELGRMRIARAGLGASSRASRGRRRRNIRSASAAVCRPRGTESPAVAPHTARRRCTVFNAMLSAAFENFNLTKTI